MCFYRAFTFAQNTEEVNAEEKSGPVLTLESNVIDYGTVERNSEPLRKVSFTNTGNEPLIISNCRGSCGCTVPEWPKQPIMPGEAGEIKVKFNSSNKPNMQKKQVTLLTNTEQGKEILKITAEVTPKPKVQQNS